MQQLMLSNPDLYELFDTIESQFDDYQQSINRYKQRLDNTLSEIESAKHIQSKQYKSLSYRVYHDELTGLPNRNYLFERTDATILQAHRSAHRFALLFIDLDDFKFVNDNYGHDYGDKLLKTVAVNLKNAIRETDMIARLAGDEFCILLMNLEGPSTAARIAKSIFQQFEKSIELDNYTFQINLSIGISLFPDDGQTTKQLMKNADIAMYEAKKNGSNQLQFYEKRLTEKVVERLEFENDLSSAISQDQLSLTLQPELMISSGQINSASVDMHWQHPIRGEVKAEYFFQGTSNSQILMPLLSWQIQQCSRLTAHWKAQGLDCPRLKIKLDERQLLHKEFFKYVSQGIQSFEEESQHIEFMVSETTLSKNEDLARRIIKQTEKLGFKVGITFNTLGFLPTALLESCGITTIQLNANNTVNYNTNDSYALLIKGIVATSSAINVELHINHINNKQQQRFYADLDCEIQSGDYFTESLTKEEFERILERFRISEHPLQVQKNLKLG